MWPRQTCDFSVFRIYADKDNQPAEYSADNRPLKAERYAKVSLEGFKKGDYCMTIGYPGRTWREARDMEEMDGQRSENPFAVCFQICQQFQLLEKQYRHEQGA